MKKCPTLILNISHLPTPFVITFSPEQLRNSEVIDKQSYYLIWKRLKLIAKIQEYELNLTNEYENLFKVLKVPNRLLKKKERKIKNNPMNTQTNLIKKESSDQDISMQKDKTNNHILDEYQKKNEKYTCYLKDCS